MQEISVYLVSGFMDSGKTTLIEDTLYNQGFADEGRTLIICCEDGEIEYNQDLLKKNFITLVMIENEEDFTTETLMELQEKYEPEQVFVEYNGTWGMDTILEMKLPKYWTIVQALATVDAGTFEMYLNNMRAMIMEQLFAADVVIFNRCSASTKKNTFRKSIKALNRRAQVVFESVDGEDGVEDEIELPYDMEAPVICI